MESASPKGPSAAAREVENLILQVALRDRAAFKSLYDRTSAKLFGVCLRVLTDTAEAEDALQEIFVKVWDRADRYQANGLSPMTWLITVARNHAIDRLRARKSAAGGGMDEAVDIADGAPGPEALAIASSDRGRIVECMGQLEPDKADAVRRAYLEGEKYDELAARYSVPLNTIRTWLRRSLIKLRECLSA
ncbi:sigma-70 family RNA polymerase sigma factor [Flavimaricola marinus]|uniref:ECF RNA polymerase sigma factor SigK n=1 Tax=Flavimaricola marinus TaxID=1819565 RepID=A0A238LDE2_9RHOB|nr:sigma-70 family RNA polymerase sigma factor [Flavimaricola marinus]SMY07737.1 ECF RNA polymerase sigma factor SigK [Flavimaricola marinus]